MFQVNLKIPNFDKNKNNKKQKKLHRNDFVAFCRYATRRLELGRNWHFPVATKPRTPTDTGAKEIEIVWRWGKSRITERDKGTREENTRRGENGSTLPRQSTETKRGKWRATKRWERLSKWPVRSSRRLAHKTSLKLSYTTLLCIYIYMCVRQSKKKLTIETQNYVLYYTMTRQRGIYLCVVIYVIIHTIVG